MERLPGCDSVCVGCTDYHTRKNICCALVLGNKTVKKELGCVSPTTDDQVANLRNYNIGASDYSEHKIQPWDIWLEYKLNPWDADIIKRVLRSKEGDSRKLDYEKIIHVAQERIRQLGL